MEDEINLVLRSKVLYCSLNIESAINNLLLKYLLIKDKTKTKNFSNKSGIPFQSKISLLFDIEVLSNEELLTIELLMNFRNKFLHDIKYVDFETLLKDFDSGIRNRFFKYLVDPDVKTKDSYDVAFQNLYQRIVDIINVKIENVDKYSNQKIEFLSFQAEVILNSFLVSLDLIQELNLIIENMTDLENKKELIRVKLKFEKSMDFGTNLKRISDYTNEDVIKELLKKHHFEN